jgi:hypothetical protein
MTPERLRELRDQYAGLLDPRDVNTSASEVLALLDIAEAAAIRAMKPDTR